MAMSPALVGHAERSEASAPFPWEPRCSDMGTYCVYIITNRKHGTLYTGVTNDLPRRMRDHKSAATRGFASRYRLTRLVWYEVFAHPLSAIRREK
ncbi:MAG: GIY-YIG nuclease family protein, partial [Gammaproteobacteria bacterium]|nr:GIY-YIG nuclease family protein [Gammaproteobacteria bacterium]NIR99192.1 GIY-YIG nuclease family protein [Gammaproteobacteria bacterium]NIT63126.1 GIY-YIG nuclease family protein [Gammaproteobacteria bacterium]NIV20085.1 GIY-YIG nuclease family protein [Gammaproteobacteria bacterium]NIX10191.1 GIY-YIG nuclease family protein [Gammaproteobacteria bacterium]